MKSVWILFLSVLLLSGCEGDGDAAQARTKKEGPVLVPEAVWQGNIGRCFLPERASRENCLIDRIKMSGGTPAAQAAVHYLGAKYESGYVSGWQQKGPVGIATITWPFRANDNTGTLLIPSSGDAIDVDNIPNGLADNAVWQTFLSAHPDSMPFPPAEMQKAQSTAKGVRLVFAQPIKNCHACETQGYLRVAYNFDANGRAMGSEILSVSVTR